MAELTADQMRRVEALGYVKDLFNDAPDVDTVLTFVDWILDEGRDTMPSEQEDGPDSVDDTLWPLSTRKESSSGSYLVTNRALAVEDRIAAVLRITRIINPYPRAHDGEDPNVAIQREQEATQTAGIIVDAYGLRDRRAH